MSKADEIMINIFGNIRCVTTGIYYDKLNELITSLEKRIDIKNYIIFCQPRVEEPINKIAKYFKIQYKSTEILPEDTLIVLADKRIFTSKEMK